MKTPDQECMDFLKQTFHASLSCDSDESSDSEPDMDEKSCLTQFGGLCARSPHRDIACKLVKVFNRAMVDNCVKLGSLLLFTTSSDSFMGFLGSCMKRPLLQTFLRVFVDTLSDRVLLRDPLLPDSDLSFLTGHQLFSKIAAGPNEILTVQVWQYSVEPEGNGILIQTVEVKTEFILDPNAKLHVRKRHGRLPFGLKLRPNKNQRKKKKRKGVGETKKRRSQKTQIVSGEKQHAKQSHSSSSSGSIEDDKVQGLWLE